MAEMIEADVAPGRTAYAGPPSSDGTSTRFSQAGKTLLLPAEEAASSA